MFWRVMVAKITCPFYMFACAFGSYGNPSAGLLYMNMGR